MFTLSGSDAADLACRDIVQEDGVGEPRQIVRVADRG
jgi:hypothetical protein